MSDQETGTPLSLEQIKALEKPNSRMAEEILRLAELRLADSLATGERLETKAIALFTLYTSLITAIFTLLTIAQQPLSNLPTLQGLVVFLIFGLICAMRCLLPQKHGVIGSNPDNWLKAELVECTEVEFSRWQLYKAKQYQRHLDQCGRINRIKVLYIFLSACCGAIAGILAFSLWLWH